MNRELALNLRLMEGEVENDRDVSERAVCQAIVDLHMPWLSSDRFWDDILGLSSRGMMNLRLRKLKLLVMRMRDEFVVGGVWEWRAWVVSWRVIELWRRC